MDPLGMAVIPTIPGEVSNVTRRGSELLATQLTELIRTDNLGAFHVTIPAGKELPTHEFQGEVLVFCLQGRVSVTALDAVHDLGPLQLLYYLSNEPFSILAVQNTSLLITVARRKSGDSPELIG